MTHVFMGFFFITNKQLLTSSLIVTFLSSPSASQSTNLDLANQGNHILTYLEDSRKWLDKLIRIHPKG